MLSRCAMHFDAGHYLHARRTSPPSRRPSRSEPKRLGRSGPPDGDPHRHAEPAHRAPRHDIEIKARDIKFKDAKIERITFELARLKAWRFGAKTEAMNAEQRQLFEETLAEDQASLEAQLQALQGLQSEPGQLSVPPLVFPAKIQPRR